MPVSDARSWFVGWTANPVASFHATSTRPEAVPSMAVSLWPAARSSCGSAASTFVPNVRSPRAPRAARPRPHAAG